MKIFHFYRHEDASGVSGTGTVAEGVQFTNGWCAVRWLSSKSSICFYQSLDEVKSIHGHGGKTEVVLHEITPTHRKISPTAEDPAFELLLSLINEAGYMTALLEDPDRSVEGFQNSIAECRSILSNLEKRIQSLVDSKSH